jgi:peptidoglycan hydrolase-like protein with peptidoglycan-binding domain
MNKIMNKIMNLSKTNTRFLLGLGLVAVAALVISVPSFVKAETLNRQLELGMRGTDVSAVQTFLAKDTTLYPQGLVTGYFGFLTKAAVANFQSRNGIPAVGRIGPMSLPVFNAQMSGIVVGGSDVYAPTISNISINTNGNTANVFWNTSELARGVVYYSTSPLTLYENPNSVTVSGATASTDASLRMSQNVNLQGLQNNAVYYYLIYVTDQAGNVSVTMPSTFSVN